MHAEHQVAQKLTNSVFPLKDSSLNVCLLVFSMFLEKKLVVLISLGMTAYFDFATQSPDVITTIENKVTAIDFKNLDRYMI